MTGRDDVLRPLVSALGAAAGKGPGAGRSAALARIVEVIDVDDDDPTTVVPRQVLVRFEGEDTPSERPLLAPPGLVPYVVAGQRVALLAVGKTWLVVAALDDQPSPPFGTIIVSATPTDPPGWVKCNGQTVTRTAYPRLYAAIGDTFGAGDGATTFRLPVMTHPAQGTLHYVIRAR